MVRHSSKKPQEFSGRIKGSGAEAYSERHLCLLIYSSNSTSAAVPCDKNSNAALRKPSLLVTALWKTLVILILARVKPEAELCIKAVVGRDDRGRFLSGLGVFFFRFLGPVLYSWCNLLFFNFVRECYQKPHTGSDAVQFLSCLRRGFTGLRWPPLSVNSVNSVCLLCSWEGEIK